MSSTLVGQKLDGATSMAQIWSPQAADILGLSTPLSSPRRLHRRHQCSMRGAKWRCIIFKLLLESTARVTVAAAAAAAGEKFDHKSPSSVTERREKQK